MLNLDTHILVDALADDLTKRERRLLSEQPWSISAIVLWELAKLVQLKRIEIDLDSVEFGHAMARIRIWPLDLKICTQSTQLDFKSDPADEIIAATSVIYKIPLLTRDKRILRSKLVPLA
jgi:PIN domain nuclease of toxin-antitoxin system